MKITDVLLTSNRFSRPGTKLRAIRAVAVHYTGNPGSTGMNNRNYFESLKTQRVKVNQSASYLVDGSGNFIRGSNGSLVNAKFASSHYIVGLTGEILKLIPETEWSYCTNARNKDTISIETCHPDATGKFTASSYQSLVELCADLCKRHGLDPLGGGLIRHYDATKKQCPKWFVINPQEWEKFKRDVKKEMENDMTEEQVKRIVKEMLVGSGNTPDKWAKDDWNWAKDQGIMDGTRPQGCLTRQEAASMLHREELRK